LLDKCGIKIQIAQLQFGIRQAFTCQSYKVRNRGNQIVIRSQSVVVGRCFWGGRSGNAAQLTRAEVRGGGAKPWRQKGTGRARAGTSRSPIWSGGGVTFAAKKRDYSQKVNRKMYQGAIRSILSKAVADGTLQVSDDLSPSEPKTKVLSDKLKAMGVESALILVDEVSQALFLASRNIPNVQVLDVDGVNPVSLMRYKNIVASPAALSALDDRFQIKSTKGSGEQS